MMAEHNDWAPEPWELTYDEAHQWGGIHDPTGNRVSYVSPRVDSDSIMLTDAKRIVACVNACAGVPTEWLEHIVKHFTTKVFEEDGDWYCFKWKEEDDV
jgi:YD repeat-containing protein